MIKIAIVEDEKQYYDCFTSYVNSYAKETKEQISVDVFTNGLNFIEEYDGSFDIVFMDIAMPQMNGLEAAKRLRKMDETVAVIFITTLAKYAIAGYEVDALDFLVKPVSYELFCIKLKKAISRIAKTSIGVMTVKSGSDYIRFPNSTITYVESQEHYLFFHLTGDTPCVRVRGKLKEAMSSLNSDSFVLIGRSILVNLAYVEAMMGTDVVVAGEVLPVSRLYKAELMDRLNSYLGGGI